MGVIKTQTIISAFPPTIAEPSLIYRDIVVPVGRYLYKKGGKLIWEFEGFIISD